jgi:hypothetical protein
MSVRGFVRALWTQTLDPDIYDGPRGKGSGETIRSLMRSDDPSSIETSREANRMIASEVPAEACAVVAATEGRHHTIRRTSRSRPAGVLSTRYSQRHEAKHVGVFEHLFALMPEPHGHGALRPTFCDSACWILRGPDVTIAFGLG